MTHPLENYLPGGKYTKLDSDASPSYPGGYPVSRKPMKTVTFDDTKAVDTKPTPEDLNNDSNTNQSGGEIELGGLDLDFNLNKVDL